nr:hypothetical protein [Tanacetum cinerariifolium]
MAKATSSQAWLWHHRLSHLNFDTINLLSKNEIVVGLLKLKFIKSHLCSSYELGKAKRKYTWTYFLRSKDETPEVIIDFLRLVQRGLQAQVRIIQTDKGTEFLNQTLHAYFAAEGIRHQTSVARTPEQNGMASDHVSSDPIPECQRTALEHDSLSPGIQCHENVTQADRIVTTSNERDLLFSLMFDEFLNGSSQVMSKSSVVSTADAPNQSTSITSTENMNQAEMVEEYACVENGEFINIFCTPVQDRGETSSHHVDSSNMHTFYQHHPSEHRWTKDQRY